MADTITIRAEMIDDISPGTDRIRQQIASLAEEVNRSNRASTESFATLGAKFDDLHVRGQKVASGGVSQLSKATKDLEEQGKKARESLSGLGESITSRLQYPMQQASYAVEGAVAGLVAFGAITQSSMQTATLSLSAFLGSDALGSAAFKQLHSMDGPVPFSALAAGFENLTQAGLGAQQVMPIVTALTNLSAVSLNPSTSFSAMSAAIASIQGTGMISPSDVAAFSTSGVDIWGILSKETGVSEDDLRNRILRAGAPLAVPAGFFNDISNAPNAKTGQADYNKTWAGQLSQVKSSLGDLLSTVEAPLGPMLSRMSTAFGNWATQTQERFKAQGPLLGSEWSKGDISGFSSTLANVLGNGNLAPEINAVASSLHLLVVEAVPLAHDLMTAVTPALQAFSAVVDFMSEHRTATAALITTIGGFYVLSKVATWANAATAALKAFGLVSESVGASSAASTLGGAFLGKAGASTAAEAGGAGLLAEGGAGLSGLAGPVALALGIGLAGRQALQSADSWLQHSSAPKGLKQTGNVGQHLLTGGADTVESFVKGIFGGSPSKTPSAKFLAHPGGNTTTTVNIHPGAITIPGSGNPQKVANAIPGAINDQIDAHQQMQTRRGA